MDLKNIIKKITPNFLLEFRKRQIARSTLSKQVSSLSMSQTHQDYWVYGEVYNEKKNGYFLDVGAYDGVYLSNTFILEKRYGWKGICIEANPSLVGLLERNRSSICVNACVDSLEGEEEFALDGIFGGIVAEGNLFHSEEKRNVIKVKTIPLVNILEENRAPSVIDYMSIDIEGAEERALMGFPFDKYIFNCITIERPTCQRNELLNVSGYLLIKEIPGHDCFYIHKDFEAQYMQNMFAFSNKKFSFRRWM